MTETELNEKIGELTENDSDEEDRIRRMKRSRRRYLKYLKNDRLLRIIKSGGYAPHRGYIDIDFEGHSLLHSGEYIKYPKNSNCQRWMKRLTGKRLRTCKELPEKGNHYRRLFDYWWTMY